MKAPCEEVLMRTKDFAAPCGERARPWILAATILGSSLAFIDGTVVNVAVPALQDAFHASVVDVQWVIESYGIFLSCLILAGGALGDIFGRRRIFLLGVTIFAIASAACGISTSIHELILARCVQGVGAALLVPGSLSIISASFDEKLRGQAIGTWSGFTAITTALGPVLGGWLIQYQSWRWVFYLNLPIAIAVIAICLWQVPESRGTGRQRLDWIGAVLATAGLAGTITGLLESQKSGWDNPLVYGSLAMGTMCLGALAVWETITAEPMMPPSLFSSREFTGANLITLFLYAAIGIFFFLYPMQLIQVRRYSSSLAGLAMLPMILTMFLLSRWAGGLVNRYGARIPLVSGPLIVAAGFLLFALLPVQASFWSTLFPASLVLGFGMAVTVAPLTTTVMSAVPRERAGTASGINNAVARVAGVLAIAALGIVMLKIFAHTLEARLVAFSLAPDVFQQIRSRGIELAGLELPTGLHGNTASAIRQAISSAFLSGFRSVLECCAGLAAASSGIAAWLIGSGRQSDGAAKSASR